jgi:hypothetical protein
MAKDQRLYGKFTLNFPDHPKIFILSDAAFRCLVSATLWCRQQENDGFLARRLAVAKWSLDVLQELCQNDPENPSLIEREEGWYIHDYAEHQETKADIEARRERNRAAGQKGGLAKAKQGAKRVAKPKASKPVSETVSENVARERETLTEVTTDVVTSSKPSQRGTRLDSAWMPATETVEAMRAECPHVDLRAEHRKFVDYWTAKPGKDGVKLSWDATWRNWIRRASEQNGRATNGNVHKLRTLAELTAEERAREQSAIDTPATAGELR